MSGILVAVYGCHAACDPVEGEPGIPAAAVEANPEADVLPTSVRVDHGESPGRRVMDSSISETDIAVLDDLPGEFPTRRPHPHDVIEASEAVSLNDLVGQLAELFLPLLILVGAVLLTFSFDAPHRFVNGEELLLEVGGLAVLGDHGLGLAHLVLAFCALCGRAPAEL